VTVSYRRGGTGEPLLLIHGLGGVGRYWDPLLSLFADAYDVISVDLPGFGESTPLAGERVSAEALARALGELLDELSLPCVHVVGHSLGGFVAFELAALGRATTVIGLAPAGLWASQQQAQRSVQRLRAMHAFASLTRPVVRPFVNMGTRLPLLRLPRGLTGAAALALYDSYSGSPGFMPVLRGVGSVPFTKGELLTMPVTVIFGKRDTVIIAVDRARNRLPAHTRWIELDRAGHNVPWERPQEIMQAVLQTTGGQHV
jgi:pimeloyl-ACP methyl ester carboxylesterase